MKYSIDGNQVRAVYEDFINLHESPAGFGDSLQQAFLDLIVNHKPDLSVINNFKDWETVWWLEFGDESDCEPCPVCRSRQCNGECMGDGLMGG